MRQVLLKCLAPLASLSAQEKYIVLGTKDQHLLPSELLDRAATVAAQVLSAPAGSCGLSGADVEAVRQFDVVLKWEAKDLDLDAYTGETLVRSCREWAEIREAAVVCLSALGFECGAWEEEAGA
jgi:HEAT repeat protein